MSQNERLREALLEIEVLRAREQETLQETQALLDILKVTTSGQDLRPSLRIALDKCAQVIGARVVMIAGLDEDGLQVTAASHPELESTRVEMSPQFFRKGRAVLDAQRVKPLQPFSATFPHRSVLIAPDLTDVNKPLVLIGLQDAPQQFTKTHLSFLERVTQLTSHAARNLELSAQHALLAAVIGGSSSSFAIADATDADLPLIFVNAAFEALTGYAAADVIGRNCRLLSAEAPDSPERARLRQAVKDRTGGRFLLKNRRADGGFFWNDLTLFPVMDPAGQVAQLVATQTDATERVEAEMQARIAGERLQSVLDHTQDAIVMLQQDETIAFANDATRRMFPSGGLNWQVGSAFRDNWAAYLGSFPKSFGRMPEGLGKPDLESLTKRREGQRTNLPDGREILVRAERAEDEAIVISATDTTAIRNTERLLRQRAAAVDNAIDGIAILDTEGRMTYTNAALARLLGHPSAASLLGHKWQQFYTRPENSEQLRAEGTASERVRVMQHTHADGAKSFHEVSLTTVAKVGEVLVARDITAALRNRQRLSEMDKQIEEARRREVISELAAGLAHDFNNILTSITGSASLIQNDAVANADVQQHAARILKAGSAAARLVNRMLDLGQTDDDASVFDLRGILGEVRALAEVHVAPETAFTVSPGKEPLKVHADASDVALAILNLAINAADAIPDGKGEITIALSRQMPFVDRTPLLGRPVTMPYGCISVRDTGVGIAADVLPNILKSFYTTKGDRGTGAGLAMVGAIVTRLGGLIYVDSVIDKGTSMDVMLPLVRDVSDHPAHVPVDLAGKAILVLDDQEDVAEVTASYLETCGAEVSVLTDPHLAVETIVEDPGEWAALVTDYDMPEFTGGDVVEAIRKTAPDFPIFVVTALARRLSDRRITEMTVRSVFAKPIDLGQLARALAELDVRP